MRVFSSNGNEFICVPTDQNSFGEQSFAGADRDSPQTNWSVNSPSNENFPNQNYQYQNQYQRPDHQYYQPANLKNGLSIASMVLGILGFVTSIFLIGILLAPLGLILGIIALVKANRKPHIYGGRGFAVAGIVLSSMIVLFIPIVAAIAIPNFMAARRAANEGSAIASIRTLAEAEDDYMAIKGDEKCGDLNALAQSNLVDPVLAKGEKSGYRFMVVNLPTRRGGCEIHATPLTTSTGTRSFFFSIEDGIVRAADKKGKPADKNDLPLESYATNRRY